MHTSIAFLLISLVLANGQAPDAATGTCDCSGKLANIPVCGTDGFEYHNICSLKEAQKTDPGLGRRCVGTCAHCNAEQVPGFCNARSLEARETFTSVDFHGITSPKQLVELLGIEHAGYGEDHLRRCFNSAMQRPSNNSATGGFAGLFGGGQPPFGGNPSGSGTNAGQGSQPAVISGFSAGGSSTGSGGRFQTWHGRRYPSPDTNVCLTDGTTESSMKKAICKIRSSATTSLGVRCLGTCAECATHPGCPTAPAH